MSNEARASPTQAKTAIKDEKWQQNLASSHKTSCNKSAIELPNTTQTTITTMFKCLSFLLCLLASGATAEHSQILKLQFHPVWDNEEAAQAGATAECTPELMAELGSLFHDWIAEARHLLYNGAVPDADIGEAIMHASTQGGGRGLTEDSHPFERDLQTQECIDNCDLYALIPPQCYIMCISCMTCSCAPGLNCDPGQDDRKTRTLRGGDLQDPEQVIVDAAEEFETFVALYLGMKVQEWDSLQVAEDRACLGNQGELKILARLLIA